ncbi:MAG: hypothetical protein V4805_00355 [Pseudomonadota bacterium]
MPINKKTLIFPAFVACAAAFVYFSSLALPAMVASHFSSAGIADSAMPRAVYIGFMLGVLIGLPTLMVFLSRFAISRPNARINLPNREIWLAPEYRAQTIAVLRNGITGYRVWLLTFLCYMHWLVVCANQSPTPHLSQAWFIGGLALFMLGTLIWLIQLMRRFRKRP